MRFNRFVISVCDINLLQVMNDEMGYIMFKGARNTIVTYDPANKDWTMEIVNNPKVFAKTKSLFENLLMGRYILICKNL